MPYKDPEKRKEYARKYSKANAGKVAEYQKKYYDQNRESIRLQQAEYRDANRDLIAETNRRYYEEHKNEIVEKRREYRHAYYLANRERLLEFSRQNFKNNRPKHTARQKQRRKEWADWLWDLKKGMACGCGEKHPSCLDFHHLEPEKKDDLISRMVRRTMPKDKIEKEMAKCVVVCSNCHRKLHCRREL